MLVSSSSSSPLTVLDLSGNQIADISSLAFIEVQGENDRRVLIRTSGDSIALTLPSTAFIKVVLFDASSIRAFRIYGFLRLLPRPEFAFELEYRPGWGRGRLKN